MASRAFREVRARLTLLWADEAGMSTVEYAIGTIVICPWVCVPGL